MLRGKESYLRHTSGGHTGAQVIRPSGLRIRASLQGPVLIRCRYWRSGDYISGKPWSPCAGDRGTKAGDLMGRRIRSQIWKAPGQYQQQDSSSLNTRTVKHGQKHMYTSGYNNATHSQSCTCKSKHCPWRYSSGSTEWHAEWRHMGTLREENGQEMRGNLLFWSLS